MAPSESQLRGWVQQSRDRYEETSRLREEGVSDSPQLDKGLGSAASAIGLSKLALGDEDEGREWLQRAADHYETALQGSIDAATDDPSSALVPWSWRATCYGYLAGDLKLIETALDRVADAPSQYPKLYPDNAVRLYRLLAFHALFQDDADAAREHLDDFRRYARAHDKDESFATTAGGLLDDNPERIAAGIEAESEHHYDRIEDDPDKRAVCEGIAVNALIMLTLATERGYDIEVEHEGLLDPPAWTTTK